MSLIANNIAITLVCYDITSNKLRRRIDKCMKDFGVRLQFSVFMCRLDADGVSRCKDKLRKVIDSCSGERNSDDSLIVFERLRMDGSIECMLGGKIGKAGGNIEMDLPLYTII